MKVNFFGNNKEFMLVRPGTETILSGGNQTGKTTALMWKALEYFIAFPNAKIAFVRERYSALIKSAVRTFEKCVEMRFGVGVNHPACPITRTLNPYQYKNRLGTGVIDVFGGRNIEDVTSTEYDHIVLPQVEELSLDKYEQIIGRCTGRANNAPIWFISGDCNPRGPYHWVLHRPEINLLPTTLKDNPLNWNHEEEKWTRLGAEAYRKLSSMTGVRRARFFQGLWEDHTGLVFSGSFDRVRHVLDKKIEPSRSDYVLGTIDWGTKNPTAIHWWLIGNDGEMTSFKEIYYSGRTAAQHAYTVKQINKKYNIDPLFICDIDPDKEEVFRQEGIRVEQTVKTPTSISSGLDIMRERFDQDRLFYTAKQYSLVEEDYKLIEAKLPTCTVDEYGIYSYREDEQLKHDSTDENPIKGKEHGIDSTRYGVLYEETRVPWIEISGEIEVGSALPGWLQ